MNPSAAVPDGVWKRNIDKEGVSVGMSVRWQYDVLKGQPSSSQFKPLFHDHVTLLMLTIVLPNTPSDENQPPEVGHYLRLVATRSKECFEIWYIIMFRRKTPLRKHSTMDTGGT